MCLLAIVLTGLAPTQDEAQDEAQDAPQHEAQAPATGATVVPAYRQANHIAVLSVHGPIDRITLHSLERRVRQAVDHGATAIVLDIDTPGGELTATLDICHLIKTEAPANTIAWINPQAYSAGTIIALAAREIVVQENATFGDAAPIIVTPFGLHPLSPAERAKAESPILTEVRDSARRNHYDENLVQAFVSVGIELWMLENIHTGERIFVDREEYREVFDSDPPTQITSITPLNPQLIPSILPNVGSFGTRDSDQEDHEQVELLDEEELPPIRPRLTSEDRDDYRLLRQVISGDQLLTVKPLEAMHYGLTQQIIRNDEELRAYFGAQTLTRYDQQWSESLARFLTSFPVRALLIIIFLVALFIELSAPGVGVFGATALAALVLFVGAPALVGMAQWWGILLILIGLVLIGTELFILPGLGIAGILGLLGLLVGLVATFVTGDLGTVQGRFDLWAGLTTTILAILASGVLIWLISRQIHSMPLLDRLILKTELGGDKAGSRQEGLSALGSRLSANSQQPTADSPSVGDEAVAHTDLRPNGRALVSQEGADRLIDVQSVEGFIEKGTPLRIVSVGKFVIEVERQ